MSALGRKRSFRGRLSATTYQTLEALPPVKAFFFGSLGFVHLGLTLGVASCAHSNYDISVLG